MISVTPQSTDWRKSSRCSHGDCVEVGVLTGHSVAIRDTKNDDAGPVLVFTGNSWRRFIRHIQTLAALAALSAAAVLLLLTVR
jgi:hypothetical protein